MRLNLSMWLCALAALLILSGTPFCRGQNPPGTVYVEGQNLSFHVIDDVQLTAIRMNGFLVPRAGKIASLDDRRSFTLQIRNAETRISAKNLTALLNTYILPHAQTAIHDVDVTFDGQTLLVKGSLKKGLSVPFEGKGVMSVTPEGDLRVHFTDFKAAGILKKGLLEALGLKLSSVATPKHQPSFQINDNDVIVSVMRLFPPPHVAGKLVSVRVDGDSLVQVFGQPDGPWKPPLVKADNYIYFRGGKIRFGKMIMEDVDLQLIDQDPSTPFDFWLDHYREQIEAGYSKSLPNLGMLVYIPDYASLAKAK